MIGSKKYIRYDRSLRFFTTDDMHSLLKIIVLQKFLFKEGNTTAKKRKGVMKRATKNTILLTCFFTSIILLVASLPAAAQKESTAEEGRVSNKLTKKETPPDYSVPTGPLTVPVFPRGHESEELPQGADLRDSYIVLEDGSVLSAADWILGSLNKDKSGIAMTDYENRLFLGQVARAAVGMDENLVNRSLVYSAPTLGFKQAPPPKGFEAVAQYLGLSVLYAIFPGTPEDYDPSKVGGAFSPTSITGGGATILFQRQFVNALDINSGDLRESGTMQIMLKEQKDKLAEEENE